MLSFKQFLNENRKIFTTIIANNKFPLLEWKEIKSGPEDAHLAKIRDGLSDDQRDELKTYQRKTSFGIISSLLVAHHLGVSPPKRTPDGGNIELLDKASNNKIGKNLTVFSGLGFDPREQIKQYGGEKNLVFLPAPTSCSLNKDKAEHFSRENYSINEPHERQHILKLYLKPDDKGIYSGNELGENELILPRNITLRIHKSITDPKNPNITTHHATIEPNIEPDKIIRDETELSKLHPQFFTHFFDNPEMEQHHEKLRRFLKEDLTKKIESGNFTQSHINTAMNYGYYDPETHDNLIKNTIAKKLKDGDFNLKFMRNFVGTKFWDKDFHTPLAKIGLSKILEKMKDLRDDDIVLAKDNKYWDWDLHPQALRNGLRKALESGNYNSSNIYFAKRNGGWIDDVHIPAAKVGLSKKLESGQFSSTDISDAKKLKFWDENLHIEPAKIAFSKILEKGDFDNRYINEAKNLKFWDENLHIEPAKLGLAKKLKSGNFDSMDIDAAKDDNYWDENLHLPLAKIGFTKKMKSNRFKNSYNFDSEREHAKINGYGY